MAPRDDAVVPRRRLRHRIPTSLRRYWKWPTALLVLAVATVMTIGTATIRPIITGDERVISSSITENIVGSVGLFDDTVRHEFAVTISDAEYADMIDSFVDNGEKKWVTADVVVDGTAIKDVGVRLKGNSTLMSLRGGTRLPDGMAPPEDLPTGDRPDGRKPDAAKDGPTGGRGQLPGGFDGMTTLSADDPTSLPLLISFDKGVEGRAYQGLTQLSVRPGSPVINESMALSLTAATGQPTQRFAYAVYSINGGKTATRLLLEYPDADYADSLFDSNGYLYKADAASRFEYVDGDQSSYSDQFKQINSDGNGNLQPIIRFLKWMKGADDAEFDAHLSDWVDVESFARYLGTQHLLSNMDDMSGPGQNYYLWYDLDTAKISVISWDLNLAMQGDATAGPHEQIAMGPGMRGPDGGGPPAPPTDLGKVTVDDLPQRLRGGNALKARFLASKKFTAVYDRAYWTLFDQIYGDGAASTTLDRLAAVIPTSDGLTADELATSVRNMRTWIGRRTQTLTTVRKG